MTHADHLAGRVMDRVRQVLCGLHGHDSMLQFEQDRMYLRCVSCGHETPGWELNETAPTMTVKAPKQQPIVTQPIVRPQLINARRVA